jgi:hypothetical protein
MPRGLVACYMFLLQLGQLRSWLDRGRPVWRGLGLRLHPDPALLQLNSWIEQGSAAALAEVV